MTNKFFAALESEDDTELVTEATMFSDQEVDFFDHLEVELPSDAAMEGVMGSIGQNFKGMVHAIGTDAGSWLKGREAKRRYIESVCNGIIEWLEEKDSKYPKLDLTTGSFSTWFKTSEFAFWRFFFLLDDHTWGKTKAALDHNERTPLEALTNMDISARRRASDPIKNAKSIKELIGIVRKYIQRSNEFHEKALKQERKINAFPFQVILAGAIDLRITMKKTVTTAL